MRFITIFLVKVISLCSQKIVKNYSSRKAQLVFRLENASFHDHYT